MPPINDTRRGAGNGYRLEGKKHQPNCSAWWLHQDSNRLTAKGGFPTKVFVPRRISQVPAQFHMKFRFGSGGEPEEDWGNDAP